MEGRILTFNRSASNITGLAAGQTIGRDIREVMQLPAQFIGRLHSLGETRSHRADHQYRSPDGRLLDIGLTVTTLSLPDGRSGYLFTFQDVTDVRRLERGARMQQRLAAVGEMAAGIAHEIRNPLASMSGSIQVLRQELPLSEEQAQLMDIVLKESERLNDTIKSFLAYARPQRVVLTSVDVRRVVQDTAMLLRNSSELHDDHHVDVDLPAEPVWIEADENQIKQIVWNLATNGLRAMASGGRLLMAARTERDTGQDDLTITISDQGCGIPPADLDGLFQPFRSTFDKGTGLGLATVHRIVTDYNGSIQVSSTVGSGTTVRVRLPQGSAASAARETSVVTAGRAVS
jgi:two-component system sensor histidine kinase PilS (NtrC family)